MIRSSLLSDYLHVMFVLLVSTVLDVFIKVLECLSTSNHDTPNPPPPPLLEKTQLCDLETTKSNGLSYMNRVKETKTLMGAHEVTYIVVEKTFITKGTWSYKKLGVNQCGHLEIQTMQQYVIT